MPDQVRTALVCLTLQHGGAERHLLKLTRALRGSPIAPVVISLDRDAPNDLKEFFDADGIPVVFPPHPRNHPGVLSWLARRLYSGEIDVAHSFLWRADATLALAARLSGFERVICSERGDRAADCYWSRRWLPRRLLDRRLTFKVARRLVSNSAAGLEAAVRAGYPREKIQVIHNWAELPFIDSWKPSTEQVRTRYGLGDAFVVGFVGRLVEGKGALDFVVMAKALASRVGCRRVVFVVVGDGPMRGKLEALVKETGLESHFVFTGMLDVPFPMIHAMDIGVICSRSESFPNVLLEFMACGKPVVATGVGGLTAAIEDGRTGTLVPYGSTEALAEACLRFARQSELVREMGRAARERVEAKYQMGSSVGAYIRLYEQMADQP